MKNLITKTILATACLIFTIQLSAQDKTAKKYDNPQWMKIVYVDYHSAKTGRAIEIIDNYFAKAAAKAGTATPSLRMKMETGQYDLIFIWDLKEGVEQLNWEVSPDNIKWRAALTEIAGGEEKAKELMTEYYSLIRSAKSELAMKH